MEDLQAVCSNCHKFLSGESDYDPAEVTAKLADQALAELELVAAAFHRLRGLLMDLDERDLEIDIHGLLVDIQCGLQERFMPVLCEHFEHWRQYAANEAEFLKKMESKIES